ncbi:hypothetical protein GCM10027048_30540 [Hymenobacter coalescens]
MKKPKLALEYFIRLIELQGLADSREAFHRRYSTAFNSKPKHPSVQYNLVVREYDAVLERVVYEESIRGSLQGTHVLDFGQQLRAEVIEETLEVKALVLEKLSSSAHLEREVFYRHVMTDIERLAGVVAREEVFARYPYIAAALLDIKEFVLAFAPQPSEKVGDNQLVPIEKPVTGFHYMYFKEGSRQEDKSLTRSYLGELFYGLRETLGLIAPTTSLADFRAIFSGKVIKKPIMWMGNLNQLAYLIKCVEPKLVPPARKRLPAKWVKAAACFTREDGANIDPMQLQQSGVKGTDVLRGREIQEVAALLK